jgi:hypothetical protein
LRDIFYKVENNLGEELRLRTSPTNQKTRLQQNQVVEEAEEQASGSDIEAAEF